MEIEMQPVSSSNVESIGYDAEENTLRVQFLNGSVYDYYNVPEPTYEALLNSPSVGQYLNMVVKPQFSYDKVG